MALSSRRRIHINNSAFSTYRYLGEGPGGCGIYPRRYLTLNEEQAPMHRAGGRWGPGGRFLDLYITTDDNTGRYVCNAIRQHQDARPRGRLRYPDNDTLLSRRSKYGIVHAEAVRFQRTSMQWRGYAGLAADMMRDMFKRGYQHKKVQARLRKATATTATHYGMATGTRIMAEANRSFIRQLTTPAAHGDGNNNNHRGGG